VLNLLLQVVATIPKPNSNLASCKSWLHTSHHLQSSRQIKFTFFFFF
jgi:hypothetical protein